MHTVSASAELDHKFGIPGVAEVCEGNGGLPRVRITGVFGEGEVYLQGAHVTSWKPTGNDEVLFVSTKSRWQEGQAIRGGIPICFPWFRAKGDNRGLRRTDSRAPKPGDQSIVQNKADFRKHVHRATADPALVAW
jgi:glucose-6-phosphate 1-epimerase